MIYTCKEGQRQVRTMSPVLTMWAAEPAAALAVHTANRRRARKGGGPVLAMTVGEWALEREQDQGATTATPAGGGEGASWP